MVTPSITRSNQDAFLVTPREYTDLVQKADANASMTVDAKATEEYLKRIENESKAAETKPSWFNTARSFAEGLGSYMFAAITPHILDKFTNEKPASFLMSTFLTYGLIASAYYSGDNLAMSRPIRVGALLGTGAAAVRAIAGMEDTEDLNSAIKTAALVSLVSLTSFAAKTKPVQNFFHQCLINKKK